MLRLRSELFYNTSTYPPAYLIANRYCSLEHAKEGSIQATAADNRKLWKEVATRTCSEPPHQLFPHPKWKDLYVKEVGPLKDLDRA